MDKLESKIKDLINEFNREADSDTPDFILAEFLINCLRSLELVINKRDGWYNLPHDMNSISRCVCDKCGQPHIYRETAMSIKCGAKGKTDVAPERVE